MKLNMSKVVMKLTSKSVFLRSFNSRCNYTFYEIMTRFKDCNLNSMVVYVLVLPGYFNEIIYEYSMDS